MGLLAVGTVCLPFLSGLVVATVALFVTGLALAPTLIALFSLIERRCRGRVSTRRWASSRPASVRHRTGSWLAGVVADSRRVGGVLGVHVSAVLAALAGMAMRDGTEEKRGTHPPLGLISRHGDVDNWSGLSTAHPTRRSPRTTRARSSTPSWPLATRTSA